MAQAVDAWKQLERDLEEVNQPQRKVFTGLVRFQDSHSPGPQGMLRGRFTWGGSHDPDPRE